MNPMPTSPYQQFSRFFWIASIITVFYTVVILQLPLLNSLGYEFSVAVSLLLPWIIGPMTINIFRAANRLEQTYASVFLSAVVQGIWLLVVPLTLGIFNIIFVRNCSLAEGLIFYTLIPVVTMFFLIAVGSFCAVLFRKAGLWYYTSVIIILGYALYLGYATPQIYSYNLIYGFFPGVSYDETISITSTLIVFRLLTVAIAFVFILLASFRWSSTVQDSVTGGKHSFPVTLFRWRWFPALIFLLLVVGGSWFYRVELGFETSVAYLRRVLDAHLTTPHFRIWYAKDSFSESEVWRIAAEHEYRYSQIEHVLQVHDNSPITSYIYPNEDVQYRMIGTRITNIAKPWRREIHLSRDSWDWTLKHELVHAMAGEFGMPVIRAHYNIGLVEGLAMAIDGKFGNRTLHEYAGAMLRFGIVRHPEQMIKPVGFAFHASSVSYVLMGSFCQYLIDRYGIMRFKDLYGGRAPERTYNRSYEELIDEWENFLSGFDIPPSWKDHIEYYFNRPSIFAKLCARKVARLNAAGYRALDANELPAAKKYFLEAVHVSDNSEAYGGLIRVEFAMAHYDSVLRLFDQRDSLQRSGLQSLSLLNGDALWAKDLVPGAKIVYNQLLEMDLSDGLNEAVALRLLVLDSPSEQNAVLRYLVSKLEDSVKSRYLDSLCVSFSDPAIYYMKARESLRLKKYDEGIAALEKIDRPFAIKGMNGYREELLGRLFFMKRDYEAARMHFWISQNEIQNQAYRDRIDDWLDRCVWYSQHERNFR
jgi:tetratricopeptide (TPR) repeat protein